MKKKKLKGMTLIEVIISIAVFAMLGLLLVTVGSTVDNMTRATTNLKGKIAEESPYAANGVVRYYDDSGTAKDMTATPITIDVHVSASGTYFEYIDPSDPSKGMVEKSYSNPSVTLNANQYDTEEMYLDGMTSDEIDSYNHKPNHGLNFKFVEIVP